MSTRLFRKKSKIDASAEEVFAWHSRSGALQRLTPHWDQVRLLRELGGILPGGEKWLKIGSGPLALRYHARHTAYLKNRYFQDIQEKGPFRFFQHTHFFEPIDSNSSWLIDHIEYEPPGGAIGSMLLAGKIRSQFEQMFHYRHVTTSDDIRRHRRFIRKHGPLTFLISGSSGVIASSLVPFLTTGGHRVYRLVRRPTLHPDEISWDPASGNIDSRLLDCIDVAIHLAGENIGEGRWTEEKKKRIIESRTKSTELLVKAFCALPCPPTLLLCASAIGIYGNRGNETVDEQSVPGDDFISEVCQLWEKACKPAEDAGMRVAKMRIGVTLTPRGGALRELLRTFQYFVGGRLGSGKQMISWISIEDILGAIYHIIDAEELQGPINLVAPQPVSNLEMTHTLADILHRPALFPVPEWLLRLAFGQMADEIPLSSTKVHPGKLLQSGYRFRYPDLRESLAFLLGKVRLKH